MQGISIREFARRDDCNESLVRRALKSGWLQAFEDGSLEPQLVGTGWREGNRKKADAVRIIAADDESIEAAADRIVRNRGMLTKAEAECAKENYLAALRELQLLREVGAVVEVEAVAAEQARDHAIVRNLVLGLGSKLAPTLVLLDDPEIVKTEIDDAVDQIFEAISRGKDE